MYILFSISLVSLFDIPSFLIKSNNGLYNRLYQKKVTNLVLIDVKQ